MTQGFHEAPNPETKKARKHQENALKNKGDDISNVEILPTELSPKGMTKSEYIEKYLKVYHGSNRPISVASFDFSKVQGRDEGYFGIGAYFTLDKNYAENYGKFLNTFYIQKDNLYEPRFESSADDFTNHQRLVEETLGFTPEYGDLSNSSKITEKLQKQGYNGLIFEDGYEIVVFNPQIINHIDPAEQYDAYQSAHVNMR